MNIISLGSPLGPRQGAGLAPDNLPILLIAADHANFALLEHIDSEGLRGTTPADFAVGSQVAVAFSPDRSVLTSVISCEDSRVELRFEHPLDIDQVLGGESWAEGSGKPIRIPPIRLARRLVVERGPENLVALLQDISPRSARLACWNLHAGDEIVVQLSSLGPCPATVRWTQSGLAGIIFSPPLPFSGFAQWAIAEQFGTDCAPAHRPASAPMATRPVPGLDRLLVLDTDYRRRAAVCHSLGSALALHVEPVADSADLASVRTDRTLVLVHDSADTIGTLLRETKTSGQWLPVVGYAELVRVASVVKAIKQGALDYLTWPFAPSAVMAMLERLAPDIEQRADSHARRKTALDSLRRLSNRETQILKAMIGGLANRQIAAETGLSVRTVETHRANILRKLGANHSSDAIRIGLEAGLDRLSD